MRNFFESIIEEHNCKGSNRHPPISVYSYKDPVLCGRDRPQPTGTEQAVVGEVRWYPGLPPGEIAMQPCDKLDETRTKIVGENERTIWLSARSNIDRISLFFPPSIDQLLSK